MVIKNIEIMYKPKPEDSEFLKEIYYRRQHQNRIDKIHAVVVVLFILSLGAVIFVSTL